MKKIFGLCLVMLLSSVSLFAQDNQRRGQRERVDPKERIENMIKELELNEDQAEKFRTIETEYADKMRADFEKARDNQNVDREKMRKEMEKQRDEKNEKIKEILTEDQYKKYLEKQQRPPRDGNGPGNRPRRQNND